MRVFAAQVAAAFALLLLVEGSVLAQDRPIVAVFDIEVRGPRFDAETRSRLTDYLGTLLVTRGFQVVPRSQLKERLVEAKKGSYRECFDQSCQIEIGKELAAQKSIAAQVLKIGSQCKVTLNLFDLKKAAAETAGMASGGCAEDDVVTALDKAVAAMLGTPVAAPGASEVPADLAQACQMPLEPEGIEGLDLSEARLNQLAMAVKRRAGAAGPELARLTGCLGFLRLEGEYRRVLAIPLRLPGTSADARPIEKKLEAVSSLARKYEETASKSDPFWQVASSVRYGEVILDLSNSLLDSPAPAKLSPEEREAFVDAMQQQVLPIEERASAVLRKALEVARLAGLRNGWTRRAEAELSKVAPQPAQVEKAEVAALEWVFSRPAGMDFSRTEVTVAKYRACVEAGKCSAPFTGAHCNWGQGTRDSHPVNCVDWSQATTFCEWIGGRLPTEQEWFAEASDGGKRKYPWGDQEVSCERAIWSQGGPGCGMSSTWPVCSKTAGNSVSGLCDLCGNVWEWTSSSEGSNRVLRGGSYFGENPRFMRASYRTDYSPGFGHASNGFRCARSAKP